jgi:hypothetical protein
LVNIIVVFCVVVHTLEREREREREQSSVPNVHVFSRLRSRCFAALTRRRLSLVLNYDYTKDTFNIGINCWGICGDADNNGDPNSSSPELVDRGGVDLPNFRNTESFAVALDLGLVCLSIFISIK